MLEETKVENGNDSYVPTAPITYNQLGCLNQQHILSTNIDRNPVFVVEASANRVSVFITNGEDEQICLCQCGQPRAVAMH